MPEDSELDITISLGAASFSGSGEASTVMKALERFTELVEVAEPPVEDGEEAGGPPADVEPAKPGEKVPLPVFLRERSLNVNAEVATAIVGWAQIHDGKTSGLKRGEIAAYWRGTKRKEPGNLGRDLGTAVKTGLLHREAGRYTITGFGKSSLGIPD